jgi:hypothetical protein
MEPIVSDLPKTERQISGSTLGGRNNLERLKSFLRGEQDGERRIPFWHPDLRKTRHQVTREWIRTSKSAQLSLWLC